MQQKINYIALLIMIILGVAIGNLTSSWLTTKYNNTKAENAANLVPKVLSDTTSDISKNKTINKPEQNRSTGESTRELARETVKLSPKNQTQAEETTPAASSEELIEQRRLDENGLRLSKKCNEWTVVHKDMNTPSSERGMNKHCANYYDYISFGRLPDAN